MPSSTSPLPPPALLAQRYRLERRIAQGGMAEVWLATDMSLSRQVAVKILKSTLATDPVVAERFRREAITVARLSHPNIVAVHDTIDYDGRQAVVMQLINGKSLRQLLDEQKRLGPELTMHIGSCVAAALDAAHHAGLVHRDVKPGNILITPDGRVLLADFGIAKGLGASDDLTSENVMMGTAKYLSPEQVRGKKLDGRADLYALGLVLYECLAGRVPFLGETDADTALARLQRDPTDLIRLRPTLPYGLAPLIHELLARNPDDRPSTGGDLRNRLARISSGVDDRTTTMTPPTGTKVPGRNAEPRQTDTRNAESRDGGPGAGGASPNGASPDQDRGDAARPGTRTPPSRSGDGTPTRVSQPMIRPSGATPRQGGAARPIHAPPPVRDRTPTSGSPRGVPARQFQQRRAPSIIVITLLLLAVIVGAVLLSEGDSDNGSPDTLPAPTTPVAVGDSVASGLPAAIVDITTFDPDDPNGGGENLADTPLTRDGDTTTAWKTDCYNNKYLNGKTVGLVLNLSDLGTGTVTVTMNNGPYQLMAYASAADTAPSSIDGWGSAVQDTAFSDDPGTVSVAIDVPARHVLLRLAQIGDDDGCRADFPYRGAIGDVVFTPAA